MYTPILAALGFILSPDRKKTLLVHRIKRENDLHFGKYNGLGGKMEPGEDIITCLRREILEEAGIICEDIALRGTINWHGFGAKGEDWFGFVFLVQKFSGEPCNSNSEGDLVWKDVEELHTLPMWDGDRYFLPLVFDNDPKVFHGHMPYKDGKPMSWQYSRI